MTSGALEGGKTTNMQIVKFEKYCAPGFPPDPIIVLPENPKWEGLLRKLSDLGVESWKPSYVELLPDGILWSLRVQSTVLNVVSSGMNAFPPNFEDVQLAIERAAKTKRNS